MKSCKYLLLAIFALLVSLGNVAADDTKFGYVNVADAMLLHPTMRYFNAKAKRFTLKALNGVDENKRLSESQTDYKKNLENLKQSLKDVEEARRTRDNEYVEELKAVTIPEKTLKTMSKEQQDKHNIKKTEIEKKYYTDVDVLRRKAYDLKQRLDKYANESIYIGLTSDIETSKIFSLMLDDIYSAMETVADHYKVSFVINSSAEISFIEGNFNSDNPMDHFLKDFDQTVQEKEGKSITAAAINNWLMSKNTSFYNCNDRRLTSFVMRGGVNMTPAVVHYIYQKYKIGKDQCDFIFEYFDKLGKGEDF